MTLPSKFSIYAKSLIATSIACIGFSASSAASSPIAYDDFEDYTAGASINSQDGGFGWSGAWSASSASTQVDGSSITYNAGGVVRGGGNSLILTDDSIAAFERDVFATNNKSGDDYFVSFIFQVNSTNGATGDIGGTYTSTMAMDDFPNITTDTLGVLGKNSKPGARVDDQSAYATTNIQFDQTYFVVVKYSGWDGSRYLTSTVWLNPAIADENTEDSSIMATITVPNDGNAGSDGFKGIQVRGAGLSDANYQFDDYRVGNDWDSVVSANVPESAQIPFGFGLSIALMTLAARVFKRSKKR